jgi:hypothetical protein
MEIAKSIFTLNLKAHYFFKNENIQDCMNGEKKKYLWNWKRIHGVYTVDVNNKIKSKNNLIFNTHDYTNKTKISNKACM